MYGSASGALAEPLPYPLCEPRPGISHARNAGVAASRGFYVAFLDDDEVASPLWLASLLAAMREYATDIVVGPVRPAYPAGVPVPAYAYAKRIYERDAGPSTG